MKVGDIENIKQLTGNELMGIYFLMNKGVVIYVGQSHNIKQRMLQHYKEKIFDAIFYFECDESQLTELEAKYIDEFNPSYNKTHVFKKVLYQIRKQNKPNKNQQKDSLLIKELINFSRNADTPCTYHLFEIEEYLKEKTGYHYTDKEIIRFLDNRSDHKIHSKYCHSYRLPYIAFADANKYLRRIS